MSNQQALEDWLILSPPRCGLSCFVLLVVKSSIFFFCVFFPPTIAPLFFPPLCFFLCRIVLDFCECGDLRRHQRWGEFPPALGNPLSVWTTPFPTVGSSVSRRRYYFNLPREFLPFKCSVVFVDIWTALDTFLFPICACMHQGGVMCHSIILAAARPRGPALLFLHIYRYIYL